MAARPRGGLVKGRLHLAAAPRRSRGAGGLRVSFPPPKWRDGPAPPGFVLTSRSPGPKCLQESPFPVRGVPPPSPRTPPPPQAPTHPRWAPASAAPRAASGTLTQERGNPCGSLGLPHPHPHILPPSLPPCPLPQVAGAGSCTLTPHTHLQLHRPAPGCPLPKTPTPTPRGPIRCRFPRSLTGGCLGLGLGLRLPPGAAPLHGVAGRRRGLAEPC